MNRTLLFASAMVALSMTTASITAQRRAPAAPPLKPGQYEWHPERAATGPVVVIVSLPDQQAYVYRNGIRIGRTSVSSGRPGHATPTGVFTILQKDQDHRSNLYNGAPMPFMERLTWDGIALHAGNLPGYPASHGCVRLPLEFSKLLFGVTTFATTVVIADDHAADDATLHPGLLLASAHLDPGTRVAALAEPPGQWTWTPEAAPTGPLTILVSGADRTVYVQRNGTLIGRAGVSIVDPARPLAPGVFVMTERTADGANAFAPGSPNRLWQAVSLPDARGAVTTTNIVDRLRIPTAFARGVYDALAPGTTLMVTDRPASGYTTTPADFVVMASDAPAGR